MKDKREVTTELEEVLKCHLFHDVLGGIVSTERNAKGGGFAAYRVSDHLSKLFET
jgi:hypothetical protein